METEEILVDFSVWQIVTRNVAERAQTFEDVVGVWVFDDVISRSFFVAEESLLVEEGGQITIDHLGMVSNSHLLNTFDIRSWFSV